MSIDQNVFFFFIFVIYLLGMLIGRTMECLEADGTHTVLVLLISAIVSRLVILVVYYSVHTNVQ